MSWLRSEYVSTTSLDLMKLMQAREDTPCSGSSFTVTSCKSSFKELVVHT